VRTRRGKAGTRPLAPGARAGPRQHHGATISSGASGASRVDAAVTTVRLLLLAAVAMPAPGAAAAVTDAERLAVYQQFRGAFDAHHYQDALPLAAKLVAMTEEQYGATDRALVNPLANLGTTEYRLHDYKSAEETYLRGVKIAADTGGNADRLLLRPLHGLGATYYATQQYEDASLTLQRALDLSRNLDGLLTAGQLPILESLIDSLVHLERHAEADREFQYEVRVAESAWGSKDVRVMRPLDGYAHWLEHMGRYPAARAEYARELTIAENTGNRAARLVIDPLRGIARTYRLEATNGGEEESAPADAFMQPGLSIGLPRDPRTLNPDGERALTIALHTIDKAQPVDHHSRGLTLMELGDWYLCAGQVDKGLGQYRDAWKELQQAGASTVLAAPRQLSYRAPPSSISRSPLAERENTEEHSVEATFAVTREGRITGVTTNSSDATSAQQKQVLSALKHARYAPRLENGEPVDTQGVKLVEKLLTKRPRQQ
jgi:tetratricopeptide (TPR) repeat protein